MSEDWPIDNLYLIAFLLEIFLIDWKSIPDILKISSVLIDWSKGWWVTWQLIGHIARNGLLFECRLESFKQSMFNCAINTLFFLFLINCNRDLQCLNEPLITVEYQIILSPSVIFLIGGRIALLQNVLLSPRKIRSTFSLICYWSMCVALP